MTARERAKLITPEFSQKAFYADAIESLIEQAIIAAVEEEREACAGIADDQVRFFDQEAVRLARNKVAYEGDLRVARASAGIASQIRARSNPDPS